MDLPQKKKSYEHEFPSKIINNKIIMRKIQQVIKRISIHTIWKKENLKKYKIIICKIRRQKRQNRSHKKQGI